MAVGICEQGSLEPFFTNKAYDNLAESTKESIKQYTDMDKTITNIDVDDIHMTVNLAEITLQLYKSRIMVIMDR